MNAQTIVAGRGATPGHQVAPESPASGSPVVRQALALLDQLGALLARIDDAAYRADSARLAGGTIGKHVRHTLDHFAAALVGHAQGGPIDYDHRERDVPMETRRDEAARAAARVRDGLAGLAPAALASPVRVRVMLAADGTLAELGSTLGREIAFASHHAVHHFAMIKSIAAEFGCDAGPDFGKAPSTLHHEAGAGGADAVPRVVRRDPAPVAEGRA